MKPLQEPFFDKLIKTMGLKQMKRIDREETKWQGAETD